MMVSRFLQYLEHERRLSPHTLTAYRTDLEQFSRFLETEHGHQPPEAADFQQLRSWVVSLSEQKLDNRSINRKIATLRAFFTFLSRKGLRSTDPTALLKSLKTDRPLPAFVREQELETLLDAHDFPDDFAGKRDRLVLELLYGTGIRLAELLALTDADVDAYAATLTVTGKRSKTRVIPLPAGLLSLIDAYQTARNGQFSAPKNNVLILTDTGTKAYPVLVQRVVKRYLTLVTSLEKRSPHVLRHSFATHLLNNGADLNAIKDLLGHASLAATQVYTHNSIEKLKAAHRQAHPKA